MKNTIKILISVLVFFFLSAYAQAQDIFPKPVSIENSNGSFEFNPQTYITADSRNGMNLSTFKILLNSYAGINIFVDNYSDSLNKTDNPHSIILLFDSTGKLSVPESYQLEVKTNNITIKGSETGVFRGLMTLFQLIQAVPQGYAKIPCMKIYDYPRFPYRGMHLDVARHFFPKEFVKKYIDYLAFYKMNTFHWHLTDDQGWRIEIKKYPKLTQTGAFRRGTLTGVYRDPSREYDTLSYGGYYTQSDITDIVSYAKQRHITVIPEIEMPGHSLAALASYPKLSCTGGPFEVAREWGVFEDVFCTKEKTLEFIEGVLAEVAELFPGKYIHIGGDEVPKTRWKKCPECQARMKKEGLKDEAELQSYFIHRAEKFLNSKGKSIIGWDEILEGGLAPNATVMSWQGIKGGIEAAKQNHNVIMTPGSHCYFDYYQGDPRFEPIAIGGYITAEKVYSYEPVPAELDADKQKYILGAQGNLWTEYIPDGKQVEYMIFPRICALSEVVWTPKELKDEKTFFDRIYRHFDFLNRIGVNYSKAILQMKSKVISLPGMNGVGLELIPAMPNSSVYYSMDGSVPNTKSNVYLNPVEIINSVTVKAVSVFNGEEQSTIEQTFHINKATGKSITLKEEPSKNYNTGGAFTLVDGILGRIPWYGKEWLGFSGNNLDAVIDLGAVMPFSTVKVDVLNAEASWIYLPSKIEILISEDGVNYTSVSFADAEQIKKQNREIAFISGNLTARYVRVIVTNLGKIPTGKPGEGYDAWLFVDEISIE